MSEVKICKDETVEITARQNTAPVTNEEALNELYNSETYDEGLEQAIYIAIEALEKQIPKKWVEEEGYDGDSIWKCPFCEEYFALMEGTPKDNEYHYCPNCGQRLE